MPYKALITRRLLAQSLTPGIGDLIFSADLIADLTAYGEGDASPTFSRPSPGTYKDGTGQLQLVANNAPRFTSLGIHMEKARTNVVLYSNALDQTPEWVPTNSTVAAGTAAYPFFGPVWTGGNKVAEDGTTDLHTVFQEYTGLANQPHSLYGFAKKDERDWVVLAWWDYAGNLVETWFNLTTGTKGTSAVSGGGLLRDYDIEAWGNGWYLIWLTVNGQANTSHAIDFELAPSDGVSNYAGTVGYGAYFIGGQVERGRTFHGSYVPTGGITNTYSKDSLSYPAAGNLPSNAPCTIVLWATVDDPDVTNVFSTLSAGGLQGCSTYISAADGRFQARVVTAVEQAAIDNLVDPLTRGVTKKIALAYQTDDVALYASDVLRGTDSSADLPLNNNKIAIGMGGDDADQFGGHIKKFRVYAGRLSLSDIQRVT